MMKKQGENPFNQIHRQREEYVKWFSQNVFNQGATEITNEVNHKIRKNLNSWIVTSRNSEIVLDNKDLEWWEIVVPLNHELIKALSLFGKESKNSITEMEFSKFIRVIGAIKPPSGYWNTGPVVPELENSKSYIVEKFLQSFVPDEIEKGLSYSMELKLINNFELIEALLPRLGEGLREKGYRLLVDWLIEYPNKYITKSEDLLKVCLNDESHTIRKIALEYLALGTKPYDTKMLQSIQEKLKTETYYENIELIVESMEFFDNRPLILEILTDLYGNRIFKNYSDMIIESNKLKAERDEILINTRGRGSNASRNGVLEIEKKLGELSKHISQWDNVLKIMFEVSATLELKDMGYHIMEFFDLIYERNKGSSGGFTSVTNELKFTLNAMSTLKPEGVTDKLISVLHESHDDYLKYLIIKTLGDLKDSCMINEIRPFLNYDDQMSNIDTEDMKIQASDSLSKLGDLSSFDTIFELFVSQEDKEVSLEGDMSYLRSLRRLDRKRLENKIWRKMESSGDLGKSLATYSGVIRYCGGEISFRKLKRILFESGDIFDEWWYAPSSTIIALPWLNPSLKALGLETGQEFLQSGREELKYVGMELSEEYFLSNESELEKYETSSNENILNLIIYFYSKTGNKKNILKFLKNKERGVANLAFQNLSELTPENYFESFHLICGDHVYNCEFIVTDSGLALRLRNVSGLIVQPEKYIQFLAWNSITGIKSILKEKSSIGLLFAYKDGGSRPSALVLRNVIQWNYLVGGSIEFNRKISEVVNKIKGYTSKNKPLKEIVSTSELLLSILKKSFMKEEENLNFGREDSIEHMSKLFDEQFNANMMSLL
ncbi:MAG: hypothetical protein ACYCR9_08675 [Cuniculiplasma sp.]